MRAQSASHRLWVVPGRGRCSAAVALVAPGEVAAGGAPGVFLHEEVGEALLVLPEPAVPPGVVAIGGATARRLGFEFGEDTPWSLSTEERVISLGEVVVEAVDDLRPEEVARSLAKAPPTGGRVLWKPLGADVASLSLDLGGVGLRVREVSPDPGADPAVLQISDLTRLRLFGAWMRTGVDIVVLADLSSSMDARDMSAPEGGGVSVTRIAAVQAALRDLLRLRLEVRGRSTRLALLGFTTHTSAWFPPEGGLAGLDAGSDETVVRAFEAAIQRMGHAVNGGTAIGPALHAAGELLDRHGHADAEKLIVLLSDGADFQARSAQDAGKMVEGVEDCVQVMAELYRRGRIRLHAFGVGDATRFQRWWTLHHPGKDATGWAPNHALLRHLVAVGGGDPERCGDTEVLRAVFSGIAAGRVTDLPRPALAAPPPLTDEERLFFTNQAEASAGPPAVDPDLLGRAERVRVAWLDCANVSRQRVGRPLFRCDGVEVVETLTGLSLGRPAIDVANFAVWVIRLWKVLWEGRDLPADDTGNIRYEVAGVPALLYSQVFRDIRDLRHYYGHDQSLPGRTKQERHERAGLSRRVGALWGRYSPGEGEPTTAAGWRTIQRALLTDLDQALCEIAAMIRRSQGVAPPTELASLEETIL